MSTTSILNPENSIRLDGARLAFPTLFKPKSVNGGAPTYSGSFIIPPDHPQVGAINEIIKKVATAKWQDKAEANLKALKLQDRIALHDGDIKPYDGFAGNLYISANSKTPPGVYDTDKRVISEGEGKPYSGCIVNVALNFWAMDHPTQGKRICASLIAVQFAKDADAFTSTPKATPDAFETLGVADDSNDLF